MARKLRSNGSTSNQSLDRTKKYKYSTSGVLTEFTGDPGDTDIAFSGSKSNLRRIADLERNISILATKVFTTDGNATDADDANFDNRFTDPVRFKSTSRFDGAMDINAAVDMTGNMTMTGHILPSVDSNGTTGYDLGSPSAKWRDLYLSSGSLYVDGQKVLESDAGTIVVSADADQSLTTKVSGTGVLTLQSATTVNMAGTLQMGTGKKITDQGGTAVVFGDKIDADNNQIINVATPTESGHAATKSYVDSEINSLINGAPGALDTLNELANALGDDASFSTTVTNSIATKLPLAGGTMTGAINMGTNNITNAGTITGTFSGNVTGNVTGDVTGNAGTATALETARTISLTGDVTGSTSFDGSGNVSIAATVAANSVALGTDTTGNYVGAGATSGNGISGSVSSEGGTFTVTSNATSANSASTIVFRDASGNFSAGTVTATATTAQYADLAENYTADAHYEAGTVVMFGGDAETTICGEDMCRRVAGVVSTDPAHLMNADCAGEHVVALALQGRVPCKVTGPVAKGDIMVSAGNGMARAEADPKVGTVIGKALEAHEGGEGVIEVAVGRF
jgi:hypothetical protein